MPKYGFSSLVIEPENKNKIDKLSSHSVIVVPPIESAIEIALRLKREKGFPVVIDLFENFSDTFFKKLFLNTFDFFILPTTRAREEFLKLTGMKPCQTQFVYDSFELEKANPDTISDHTFHFSIISQYNSKEKMDFILRALENVSSGKSDLRERLNISFYFACEIDSKGVEEFYHIRPPLVIINDFGVGEALMRQCTLVALGLKVPTLAITNSDNIRDIVIFERIGSVVSTDDAESIAEAVEYILMLWESKRFATVVEPRRWGYFSSMVQTGFFVSVLERAL
ncbi:MAG: glycosyltransferase, partial [bacterium]